MLVDVENKKNSFQTKLNMAKLYQIFPIEGKGLGMIAKRNIKRGDLIFKEYPQMPSVSLELDKKGRFWQIVSFFEQMSKNDQKEYLELHNKFECGELTNDFENYKTESSEKESDTKDELMKIVFIYISNEYVEGVGIKVSRINHSCLPNARILTEDTNYGFIRNLRHMGNVYIFKYILHGG